MEKQEKYWYGGYTKADENLVQQGHNSHQNEIGGSLPLQRDLSLQLQRDQSLQLQRDRSLQLQLDLSLQLQQQRSMLRLGQMVQTFSGQQGQLKLLTQQILALQLQKQMTSGAWTCLNRCPPQTCPRHLKPDLLPARDQTPQPCVSVGTQSMYGPVPDVVLNVGTTSCRSTVQPDVASSCPYRKDNTTEEQQTSSRDSRGGHPHLLYTGSNGKFLKDNLDRHDISCKANDWLKESEGLHQKYLRSIIKRKRIKNKDGLYRDNFEGEKRSAGYSAKERAAAVGHLDNLYSEAASLIAENEQRPWFLLWMFQEMRQIQTDSQWQKLARLIHNLVLASADGAHSLRVHQKNLTRIQKDGVFYSKTQLQKLPLINRQEYEVLMEGKNNKRLTKQAKKVKKKTQMGQTYSKTEPDKVQLKPAVYIELGKQTEDLGHSQTTMDVECSQTAMDIEQSKTTMDIRHSETTINAGYRQLEQDDESITSACFKLEKEENLDQKWGRNSLARSCVCGGCPLAAGTGVPDLDESHWTGRVERQLENNWTNFATSLDRNKLADEMFSPSEDIPAYPADVRQVQEEDTNVNPHDGNSQDWTDQSAISLAKQESPTEEDTTKLPACPQELEPEGESVSPPSCVLCGILVLSLSAAAVLFLGRVIVRHFLQSPSLH